MRVTQKKKKKKKKPSSIQFNQCYWDRNWKF